ncbi:MAG: EVE domain-containing protein [Deltaproteobacteria bacterium]
MNRWLVKSEPSAYSWQEFLEDGRAFWDGVRNYQARNNLRAMKLADPVLFYHSNEGHEVAGVAEVVKEAYRDPTSESAEWVAVDIKPVRTLSNTVSLANIRENPRLQNIALIRQSRLSVMPVTEDEFDAILEMSESQSGK